MKRKIGDCEISLKEGLFLLLSIGWFLVSWLGNVFIVGVATIGNTDDVIGGAANLFKGMKAQLNVEGNLAIILLIIAGITLIVGIIAIIKNKTLFLSAVPLIFIGIMVFTLIGLEKVQIVGSGLLFLRKIYSIPVYALEWIMALGTLVSLILIWKEKEVFTLKKKATIEFENIEEKDAEEV